MTATTDRSSLEVLKQKQQTIWSSGDYNRIAALTVPVAEALVAAAPPQPGDRVLDVATGTGHAALAAARQFANVTAVDYVPALVDTARRRARVEDLQVDIREGDAEKLAFPDGAFDLVYSAIGVMFTADHARAAAELVRVTRPGGRIALASWTPTGFVGRMLRTVSRHVSAPPAAQPPTRWGDPEALTALLGAEIAELHHQTRTVTQRFTSPEHFAEFFLAYYGPTHTVARTLMPQARRAFRDDLIDLAIDADRSENGSFTSDWEYLLSIAVRR